MAYPYPTKSASFFLKKDLVLKKCRGVPCNLKMPKSVYEPEWVIRPEQEPILLTGAYPGFSSMKRQSISTSPTAWWDANPSHPFIHLGGERQCESYVSCPTTQYIVRRSGDEHTNHEATAPPNLTSLGPLILSKSSVDCCKIQFFGLIVKKQDLARLIQIVCAVYTTFNYNWINKVFHFKYAWRVHSRILFGWWW